VSSRQSWDPEWERIFRSREWGKYPAEHVIRFVARRFYTAPDRSAIRLLDLGCGAGGASTWYFAREGFDVSAVDGSETAVAKTRARLESEGLSADVRVADVIRLPWDADTFDAVVDNACLCNNSLDNSMAIVAEVHRVLKPGGWFHSVNFTDRCSDYGRGPALEPGGFARRSGDGPLGGDYYTRFAGRAQVDELYRRFADVVVDTESRTEQGGAHFVESWIVTCLKAASR
jgi:SAM-dependent methyltransferase